jgi:hypothetical protein
MNMSELIKELSQFSIETQEEVLKNIQDRMLPIEIDGNIHMVHEQVSGLIDNLLLQILELKKERSINFGREEIN